MFALKTRWLVVGASPLLATLAACAAPDPAPPSGTDVASQTTAADPLDSALRGDACTSIAPAPHFQDWPRIRSAIRSDARDEAWIRSVVAAMSLEQKVGQMTMAEIGGLWDAGWGSARS